MDAVEFHRWLHETQERKRKPKTTEQKVTTNSSAAMSEGKEAAKSSGSKKGGSAQASAPDAPAAKARPPLWRRKPSVPLVAKGTQLSSSMRRPPPHVLEEQIVQYRGGGDPAGSNARYSLATLSLLSRCSLADRVLSP